MKKSGLFAASAAAAASAISASSSSPNSKIQISCEETISRKSNENSSSSSEKFAPRFDGLRFIETLITAHR
ncbi:uncharacterized protein LOC132309591 [Cornus florida]|uniref:uncharacterized protein LOC132309591 n=1 Tax=Cornus florida TaxID=4283 RepID=UPI00289683CC|nr:uncharacterized protein LOC132309591 [Cornus florida]